jgi:glutathione synthase
MTIKLGVVMDPIKSINYAKDSTLAMLQEAALRGWELYYLEQADLFVQNGEPFGQARRLHVFQDAAKWYEFGLVERLPLAELDLILMRKDPPFNEEYIYTTYILEHAERLGVLVVNRPQALRDANEKFFATLFPECMAPTLVTQSVALLHQFWQEQGDIVCKPLNSMGGTSIFRLREDDVNAPAVFAALTENNQRYMMAQRFIPAITAGDKRILLIDGEPIPFALARIPQGNDWRGNLVVGAKGKVQPLTERDHFICQQVGPVLRQNGLYFVGIDVIGDYLTEINVTSPTCIREIDAGVNLNIAARLLDVLVKRLAKK